MTSNNNDDYGKKSIKKPPERTMSRPDSTMPIVEIIRLPNGEEYISKKTTFQKNEETGHLDRVVTIMPIPDSSGRYFYPDMISGTSWTGRYIPHDHFAACKNPWEDHGYRLVYLKIDGYATDLGNVLCSE